MNSEIQEFLQALEAFNATPSYDTALPVSVKMHAAIRSLHRSAKAACQLVQDQRAERFREDSAKREAEKFLKGLSNEEAMAILSKALRK